MVRSRWVARDFKTHGEGDRPDLFAGMPPLELKKLLFRMATMQKPRANGSKMRIMLVDVKKAHLNGVCDKDDIYVELPEEAKAPGKCGKLTRWLYGMRQAARGWEDEYSAKFTSVGLMKGKASPSAFWCEATGLRCVVHGDDFTFLGYDEDLRRIRADMERWYKIKVRGVLGADDDGLKEVTLLSRKIRWRGGGWSTRLTPSTGT